MSHTEHNEMEAEVEEYGRTKLVDADNSFPADVRDLIQFLNANIVDEELTIERALEACGIRSSKVADRFRRYVGRGKKAYVIYHRIEMSKRLLETGRWTVGEIGWVHFNRRLFQGLQATVRVLTIAVAQRIWESPGIVRGPRIRCSVR